MGKANLPLLRADTLLSDMRNAGLFGTWVSVGVFAVVVAVILPVVDWFLSTHTGLAMQATGDNEQMIRAQGVSTDAMKILGLVISNGLVGLAGVIMAQYQGWHADIGMGIGLIVAGLASVIIGQAVLPSRHFALATLAVVLGSIIYREVIQVALTAGFDPNDMKLVSAVLVIAALLLPRAAIFRRMRARRREREMAAAAREGRDARGSRHPQGVLPAHAQREGGARPRVAPPRRGRFRHGHRLQRGRQVDAAQRGCGRLPPRVGNVVIDNTDVTKLPDFRVADYVGRVFQDPMAGTCPNGTVEQNLSMAYSRGKRRGLRQSLTKAKRAVFREELKALELGLEDRLGVDAGLLSGGQRQALSLLMATFSKPRILLLDEHTAALDPARAELITQLTERAVARYGLTTLMVTHNMEQALRLGNRLIMMHEGRIISSSLRATRSDARPCGICWPSSSASRSPPTGPCWAESLQARGVAGPCAPEPVSPRAIRARCPASLPFRSFPAVAQLPCRPDEGAA